VQPIILSAMKKMLRLIFALYPVIFITCCNTEKPDGHLVDFRFEKLEKRQFNEYVETCEIIPLENAGEESIVATIVSVKFSNEYIYILENVAGKRHSIIIFDENGKFVNRIWKQGRGPMEYQSIAQFDIHPEENFVSVLDPGTRRILNYTIAGEYLGSVKLNHYAKELCYFQQKDKVFLALSTHKSKTHEENNYDIIVLDDNYAVIQESLQFTETQGVVLGNGISFKNQKDHVNYYMQNTNTIYSILPGRSFPIYYLKFSKDILPENKIMTAFQGNYKLFEDHIHSINYFETSEQLLIVYSCAKDAFLGLYDKKSKQSLVIPAPIDSDCNCRLNLRFTGTTEHHIVLSADKTNIRQTLDTIDPQKDKCLNNRDFIIENLDITSNPVLLKLKLKL
jgi:hypothetical protein